MKQRFITDQTESPYKNLIISVFIFAAIFACFWFGISSVSEKTSSQEKQTLEGAINRGIIHCYAIEGTYPESLVYLKDNYGIMFDENRFFVDYQALGANIMPDVTIIDKEASK